MQNIKSKYFFYALVLLIIAGSQSSGFAQSKELVKTIDEIFKLCETKNFPSASKYCVQTQGNRGANRLTKKIRAFLSISDSYTIEGAQVSKKGKQEEHIVNISFSSGGRKIGAEFIFVMDKNKFLLKDIN